MSAPKQRLTMQGLVYACLSIGLGWPPALVIAVFLTCSNLHLRNPCRVFWSWNHLESGLNNSGSVSVRQVQLRDFRSEAEGSLWLIQGVIGCLGEGGSRGAGASGTLGKLRWWGVLGNLGLLAALAPSRGGLRAGLKVSVVRSDVHEV